MTRNDDYKKIKYINPYPSILLYYLDYICQRILIRPFRLFLDHILSRFLPTTFELKHIHRWRFKEIYTAILSLCGCFITFPLAVYGAMIWLLFQWSRQPYRISTCVHKDFNESDIQKPTENNTTYTFATVNACLLHEFLSRFNNMACPWDRAKLIGERIKMSQEGPMQCSDNSKFSNCDRNPGCNKQNSSILSSPESRYINHENGDINQKKIKNGRRTKSVHFWETETNHEVLEEFPKVDILLIQEAWVIEYAEILGQELHACFPYIVYDAGVYSWKSNCYNVNSGIMIASKYPILSVKFDWYRHSTSQCRLASKGLLQVKVLLGEKDGKKLVGYVYNTHLQAYQGTKPIQSQQMDAIVKWTKSFRKSTSSKDEIVVFDIVGGDFNSDNMSPVDRDNWYHPLFSFYKDICRERPGKDCHWAVGTEMRHTPLHDDQIQTPLGLKAALEDPSLLQYYVLDGIVESADYSLAWLMPQQDKKGKQKLHSRGGKRRIDYLMYRTKDEHVKAIAANPVSQLAGLTDHIPYCLTIQVDLEKMMRNDS